MRVNLDGGAAKGNPFNNEIWTLGHRNVQGADIRPSDGTLWTLEHGAAGGDELNKITAGANYGWPVVSYGVNYNGSPIGSGQARQEGFAEPQYYWDPVIAPGGFAFYQGTMFDGWEGNILAASLNPGGLVRLALVYATTAIAQEPRLKAATLRYVFEQWGQDSAVSQAGFVML